MLLVVCRTYGLDEAGAQLTRLRVALTEWDSGYEEACEATMAALRSHRYLPTLFNTFLTSKVYTMYMYMYVVVMKRLISFNISVPQAFWFTLCT